MNSKTIFLLVVALICGAVASFVVKFVFFGTSDEVVAQKTEDVGPMGEMLVANVNLMTGDELNAQNIRIDLVPEKDIPQDAIFSFDGLMGRRVLHDIAKDTPLSLFDFELNESQNEEVVTYTQPGYKIIPIQIEQVVSSGNFRNSADVMQLDQLVHPGDNVSLSVMQEDFSSGQSSTGASRSLRKLVNRTLIDSISVYSVVCKSQAGPSGTVRISTISFMMNKEEEELIQKAMVNGKIRLTLLKKKESLNIDAHINSLQNKPLEVLSPSASGAPLQARNVSSGTEDTLSFINDNIVVPLNLNDTEKESVSTPPALENHSSVVIQNSTPTQVPVPDTKATTENVVTPPDLVVPASGERKPPVPALPRVYAPRQNLNSVSNSDLFLNRGY